MRISKFETTNPQYAEFLNAVTSTDTNGFYEPRMGSGIGGIVRSGSSGSYTYGTIFFGDLPGNLAASDRFVGLAGSGDCLEQRRDTTS